MLGTWKLSQHIQLLLSELQSISLSDDCDSPCNCAKALPGTYLINRYVFSCSMSAMSVVHMSGRFKETLVKLSFISGSFGVNREYDKLFVYSLILPFCLEYSRTSWLPYLLMAALTLIIIIICYCCCYFYYYYYHYYYYHYYYYYYHYYYYYYYYYFWGIHTYKAGNCFWLKKIADSNVSWNNVGQTSGRQYRRWANAWPTYIEWDDLSCRKVLCSSQSV